MRAPKISIIIPTFNSAKKIRPCINAILHSNARDFEIIIIDDCSTDNTLTILRSYRKNKKIRLILHDHNQGVAIASNDGFRIARGQYLVQLNSDMVTDKNCLTKLIEPMEKDKKIGMTQGAIISPFTKKLESMGHFLTVFGFPYDMNNSLDKNKSFRILGTRAILAFRKKLLKVTGGFDEDYVFHAEDTDFAWRVSLAGYNICYAPGAKGYHYHIPAEQKKIGHYAFYEAAKNQVSNILKNAPLEYIWFMLPLNIMAWFFLSLKLLIQRRFNLAFYIYRGILWNIPHLGKTLQKRHFIQTNASGKTDTKKIMFGPLSTKELLLKGSRWFNHV